MFSAKTLRIATLCLLVLSRFGTAAVPNPTEQQMISIFTPFNMHSIGGNVLVQFSAYYTPTFARIYLNGNLVYSTSALTPVPFPPGTYASGAQCYAFNWVPQGPYGGYQDMRLFIGNGTKTNLSWGNSVTPWPSLQEAFVDQAHRDVARTGPGYISPASFKAYVSNGGSRAALAMRFFSTKIAAENLIRDAVQRYLGRQATAADFTQWKVFLADGNDANALKVAFSATPEYLNGVCRGDLNTYAMYLVYDFIGSNPTIQAQVLAQLQSGQPAATVVNELSRRTEAVQKRVSSAHFTLTHLNPSPTFLSFWTAQLTAGVPESLLYADLIGTAQYLADCGR